MPIWVVWLFYLSSNWRFLLHPKGFFLLSANTNEELTEIYRATDHLLAEDPNLNDKQIRAIQEARIKIEFSVPDLDTQLEHRQDYSPQMEM